MERVKIYRFSKVMSRVFIVMGSIFLLLVVLSFSRLFNETPDSNLFSDAWNSILNLISGLVFIGLGVYNLNSKTYYIEWNDEELHFVLPDTKSLEIIKFSDIESVNIKLFKIELQLENQSRTLNVSELTDADLKKIKHRFQNLHTSLNFTT